MLSGARFDHSEPDFLNPASVTAPPITECKSLLIALTNEQSPADAEDLQTFPNLMMPESWWTSSASHPFWTFRRRSEFDPLRTLQQVLFGANLLHRAKSMELVSFTNREDVLTGWE